MKKILLSLGVVATAFSSYAQVICAGVSPAAVEGNYNFTWADPDGGDWATPDFNVAGVIVEDTLALVDDGSTGVNDQGNPVSAEGCNPLVNGAEVTGKIAVIYRNTCEFGTKALNAQNAGAVGVIIINRESEVIEMGGGADGASVTIPVVMISDTDGALLTGQMQNGDVVMFLGNKTGLFANDVGVKSGTSLFSQSTGVLSPLAQNASEFSIDLATRVFNYGNTDQSNLTVTATVDGPGGNVYSESVSIASLVSGDSIDIAPDSALTFPQFSLATYPEGDYTLSYNVTLATSDEYDADNTVSGSFNVQDSVFAYAPFTNGLPVQNNGYRPSENTATFSNCVAFRDPNASRVGVSGLYFQALGSEVDLTGEEIALYAYKWEDVFTDLNDEALAFDNLTTLAFGYYYYPSDLQGETVFGNFNESVALEDNQRYLFCAQTTNLNVFLGFNEEIDYTRNIDYYLQPMNPIENDGTYPALGFGQDVMSSVGVKMIDVAEVGVNENSLIQGSVAPNPATDVVRISVNAEGNANLVIADLSGKVVKSSSLEMNNGVAYVNIANLEDGMYIFNVTMENGQTAKINVVKK